MPQTAPQCPACGSAEVLFRPNRGEYTCDDCGQRWSLPALAPVLVWPPGLAPEALPTYLAAPLAALLAETHPRVRLHWLVDCAEIAVRWSAALALAQVVQAHGQVLPAWVAARLREHIERPTLGHWLGILEALSAALPPGPLPAPGVFDLYRVAVAPRFRGAGDGGTQENSLLVLRNTLAHGAGLRTAAARHLLQCHEAGLHDLMRGVARASAGIQVLALTAGQALRLAGPRPTPLDRPAALRDSADGPWLVAADGVTPLLPLASFGPVRLIGAAGQLEERPGSPTVQLYDRTRQDHLTYVPLGRDEPVSLSFDLEAFRALFGLDSAPAARPRAGAAFRWDDFLREARILQEDLIGRAAELDVLRDWLRGRDSRQPGVAGLGLLLGGPGVGKSLLMARLARDLGNAPAARQRVYYHRFRAGDARNSLRAFLQGLWEALADWAPLPAAPVDEEAEADAAADTDQALLEAVRARLAAVADLPPASPQAPLPRVLVLADGLDEVLPYAPRLPRHLRDLACPGTVWLLASRPEPALTQALGGPGCDGLFPSGLPPMSATDIRAMLLDGLANARHALIARDEDDAGTGVRNAFVERVVARADGLPLYVHLLLEDLRAGHLTVQDEARLPQGLVAYYDDLMNRVGLSDLRRDLPLLVALLARAEEPLDPEALALLLAEVPAEAPRYRDRVRNATRAGQALLRHGPTPEGTTGLTLYHQSFRDYVGGRPATGDQPAIPPAPALTGTVRDAEAKLCRLADGWADLPRGGLRNHLFRWGVRYALRWQGEMGLAAARRRLTDFVFLQAFTAELPSGVIRGLVADYETLLARLPEGAERQVFRLWEAFFREREHILRRGDARWPAHKILLQLAVEHADDSPVTLAAEAWLAEGHCHWVWLRNPQRVARAVPDPCLRVLEGHTRRVDGALELSDGRILSWSGDKTLRFWDGQSGAPLATLEGHTSSIFGAIQLPDGRILSWSADKTLRLWDGQSGAPLTTLEGHTSSIMGVLLLPDGCILSWSLWDYTLRVWDGHSGDTLVTFEGHTSRVKGALSLSNGRILSWSQEDKTLHLWDGRSGAPLVILEGHTESVSGALLLPEGRILSWAQDGTLRLWDGHSGAPLTTLEGHTESVSGALPLPDGRILSWAEDGTLRLWDGHSGTPLAILEGHTRPINGALQLPDERFLSWSADRTLRLWDGKSGAPIASLQGHTGWVTGALPLPDERILSWSGLPVWPNDRTLRLWDGQSGTPLAILEGHTQSVKGVLPLPGGRFLSWSGDRTLRLWDGHGSAPFATLEGHTQSVKGILPLPDGRFLSWSGDHTLRLWDGKSGAPLVTLKGHTRSVVGALPLPDGHFISWSEDGTLRLWDGQSGAPLVTLRGHTHWVRGALLLPDGRVLSWSLDRTLRLWDSHSGAPLVTLKGHTRSVVGALLLPDGRFLSWSWDRTLRLWDGRSGAPLVTLKGHTESVSGALLLPDGRFLSWSEDGTLHLWDSHSGAPFATLKGHTKSVSGVLSLPDGRILSWAGDGTLRLWDGHSGAPLATLEGHTAWVRGALPLPDGRILLWSYDHTMRLWDGQSDQPICAPIAQTDLTWKHHQLLLYKREAEYPALISGQTANWSFNSTAEIAACAVQPDPVFWQGHADIDTHALLPEGTLVVTLASGHVFCLQLYRGACRITVEEYELPRIGSGRTEASVPTT